MVEWTQMRLVVTAALATLILVWWVNLVDIDGGELDKAVRLAVSNGQSSRGIIVNPVVRVPRLETSVFAPVHPCQITPNCLE